MSIHRGSLKFVLCKMMNGEDSLETFSLKKNWEVVKNEIL